MKKVRSYTAGWDAEKKHGYLTVKDVENNSHYLSKLSGEEFGILLKMLKDDKEVYIDQNNWIVSGWSHDNH